MEFQCYIYALRHYAGFNAKASVTVWHSGHRHCLSDSTIEQCSPELNAKNGCRAGLNTTKFD